MGLTNESNNARESKSGISGVAEAIRNSRLYRLAELLPKPLAKKSSDMQLSKGIGLTFKKLENLALKTSVDAKKVKDILKNMDSMAPKLLSLEISKGDKKSIKKAEDILEKSEKFLEEYSSAVLNVCNDNDEISKIFNKNYVRNSSAEKSYDESELDTFKIMLETAKRTLEANS